MEQKRIVKGNSTVWPLGAEILGQNITNSVTENSIRKKGSQPFSDLQSVIDARNWEMDNEK